MSAFLEFLRQKKITLGICAALAALLMFAAWALYPWADREYIHVSPNGGAVQIEETRRYRFLPAARWGFSVSTVIGCGDKVCSYRTFRRLGFFEMTDFRTETRLASAD
jgi:hypothetical protein